MIEPHKIDLPRKTAKVAHHLKDQFGNAVVYETCFVELTFKVFGENLWVGGCYQMSRFVRTKNRFRPGYHFKRDWRLGRYGLLTGRYVPDFDWKTGTSSFMTEIINEALGEGIVLDQSFVRHMFDSAMHRVETWREEYTPVILGKLSLARTG